MEAVFYISLKQMVTLSGEECHSCTTFMVQFWLQSKKNLGTFSKKKKDLSAIEKTRAKCSVLHNLRTWYNVINLPENLWITIDIFENEINIFAIPHLVFCSLTFTDIQWRHTQNLFQGLIPTPFLLKTSKSSYQ